MKTSTGGRTWELQNSNVTTDITSVFMLDERRGWALSHTPFVDTSTWYGTNILKTTNGGDTWTTEQLSLVGEYLNSVVFRDSLNGWLGGERGALLETRDGGTSWQYATVDSSFFAFMRIGRLRFYSSSRGFAVGGNLDLVGVVWQTTNGGQNWFATGVCPEPVLDLHAFDSMNVIGVYGDVDFGICGVIRTTNGGENWTFNSLEIFGQPTALSFRTPREGWAPLGFAGTMMYTTDAGRTWETERVPQGKAVYDLAFTDSEAGYAVGDSGVILKYDPTVVPVEENLPTIPVTPGVSQNYPNPFNPTTEISYQTPEVGHITLKVFDILGREVATLVNEQKSPGTYTVQWDASGSASGVSSKGAVPAGRQGYASGVYLYRLQSGGFVVTKKMLMVR
jgi:photosystem II stability/assembly factor-like uncharacterized protein